MQITPGIISEEEARSSVCCERLIEISFLRAGATMQNPPERQTGFVPVTRAAVYAGAADCQGTGMCPLHSFMREGTQAAPWRGVHARLL